MNEPNDVPQIPFEPAPNDLPAKTALIEGGRSGPLWKRLLACNPFYLVSVALLLFACYRISLEPRLFDHEAAHLLFNFTSLQIYELLLVVTAIFLAARRIWYDSTLLVGLENLLLLVPFILISQAALIDSRITWKLCALGGLIALGRLAALRHWLRELNLPNRLMVVGTIIVAFNAALPAVYRVLHESKFGTKPDWGAAYFTNVWVWWFALPIISGFALWVAPLRRGGSLWPQKRGLPLGLATLWTAGTATHLYCLDYVYDFSLRGDFLAPVVWTLAWVLLKRAAEIWPQLSTEIRTALFSLPLAVCLLASLQPGHKVFFTLTLLSAVIYGSRLMIYRRDRATAQLLMLSLGAMLCGFPEDWGSRFVGEFERAKWIVAAIAGYALLRALVARDPRAGLVGGVVCVFTALVLTWGKPATVHWAVQSGTVFVLLHSLRWTDAKHAGAAALRFIAAAGWVGDSFIWLRTGGQPWMTCVAATGVLIIYVALRLGFKVWGPKVIPIAAVLAMLAGPGNASAGTLNRIPLGVFALLGSFLLFGLGTAAALTRNRWHKAEQSDPVNE